jgi:hypothetical protein
MAIKIDSLWHYATGQYTSSDSVAHCGNGINEGSKFKTIYLQERHRVSGQNHYSCYLLTVGRPCLDCLGFSNSHKRAGDNHALQMFQQRQLCKSFGISALHWCAGGRSSSWQTNILGFTLCFGGFGPTPYIDLFGGSLCSAGDLKEWTETLSGSKGGGHWA